MATGRDDAVVADHRGCQAPSRDELQDGQGALPFEALLAGADAGVHPDDVGIRVLRLPRVMTMRGKGWEPLASQGFGFETS